MEFHQDKLGNGIQKNCLLTCISPSCDITLIPRFELVLLRHASRQDVVIDDDVVTRWRLEFNDGDVVDVGDALDVATMDVNAVDWEPLLVTVYRWSIVLPEDKLYVVLVSGNQNGLYNFKESEVIENAFSLGSYRKGWDVLTIFSNLQENNERKNTIVAQLCVLVDA